MINALLALIVLFADYSDPDVIRVGDDYYLVASSFQVVPGLPILHSRDLVNWTILSHAAPRLPSPDFDRPQHGNGLWAPSIRHHDGWFWIYVGDPDRGLFLTRARDPRGPWEPLTLIYEAKGLIDPCPFWDDDGSMFLVHAWAKSRAGFNSVLTMRRMSTDGRRVLDDGTIVFDGRERHPTIEGPKLYKRNGWYYIFAPAGGVKTGWQTVLRSRNVFGPYEDKVVLEQGTTQINGPHQGAWVESVDGVSWFLHFQDRGAYGRIVHRQSMRWVNDWPVIGENGQPESSGAAGFSPPTDEFNDAKLGLQWQWHGNPGPDWFSLRDGKLRLSSVPADQNLWLATNLLLQKFSAPAFTATTRIDASALRTGERAGLLVMGTDYSALVLESTADGVTLRRVVRRDADQGAAEVEEGAVTINDVAHLRVAVTPEAICRFSYSRDGRAFVPLGTAFTARPGRWIGAKVGLFGRADFDWFRVEPDQTNPSAWSVRMVESVMKRTPDPLWLDATERPRWEYTPGLVLKAVFDVAERTGDERYWKYAAAYYDGMIDANGVIQNYTLEEYNIDRINPGKPLFLLYAKTKNEKYRKAIETLRQQMREHPRTSEGGFWHKKRYPYQMWLDGLYMGAPFLAQYAKTFNEPKLFDDVIHQFVLMEKHARDAKTGLLFHGWDESRKQKWADPKTGRSPAFWGRAMGWYAMGLVETLDFIPPDHPRRRELIAILGRLAEAVTRVQDPKTGVWWQVVDQPEREGNYREASVSVMLSFALLKASRLGYIDKKYAAAGRRAYEGVIEEFMEVDGDGLVNIHRVCQVAGLGGDPERGERYRDGTFEYYVSERIRSNDPKAVGPFIFASLEMESGVRER